MKKSRRYSELLGSLVDFPEAQKFGRTAGRQATNQSTPDGRAVMTVASRALETKRKERKFGRVLVSQVAAYQYFKGRLLACDRQDSKRNPSPRIKFEHRPPPRSTIQVCAVDARDITEGQTLDFQTVQRLQDKSPCIFRERQTIGKLTQPLNLKLEPVKVRGTVPTLVRFLVVLSIAGHVVAAGFSFECFIYPDYHQCMHMRKTHAEMRAAKGLKVQNGPTPQQNMQALLKEFMASLKPEEVPLFQRQMMTAVRQRQQQRLEAQKTQPPEVTPAVVSSDTMVECS
ncbi:hypothetical protein PROFUN_02209 [Planoprotostelium fungivorum]|uniref:Uncharacterized protein n=1 Tax=Planoprotostelium fungivorum TaxID=1890364 RepID=A0A2P6NZD2_9EUKA|nr:hypothetical protein PROFUN_02209 [Planoprotostelium fungivorum]